MQYSQRQFYGRRRGCDPLRKQRDRAHGSGVQDAPPVDAVEQLRKLGELRDSGILSDEEFAAKKSVLLGKIK